MIHIQKENTLETNPQIPNLSPNLQNLKSAPANASGLDDQQPTDWERHDPSNIIVYQDKYLLWVTEHIKGSGFLENARIILLSSTDALNWKFEQIALERNPSDAWDNLSVLTAFMVPYQGVFYLFYTGVNTDFEDSNTSRRGIGYAVSNSPYGPWERPPDNQILHPGELGSWDELCVDDTNIIRHNNKWYFYFKGRQINSSPGNSDVGVAISDNLTGPYVKHDTNPLFKGHAFTVTKYQNGLLALPGSSNQKVLWSTDGIHFVAGPPLKHKSTGVYNPADFETDPPNPHIDWFIDVIPSSPRKLQRVNLIFPE